MENKKISRTTYYSNIHHKLISIVKNYFNNKYTIIAVDDTYTNSNIPKY